MSTLSATYRNTGTSGGGGGGGTTYQWWRQTITQTANFGSGDIVIALTQPPYSVNAIDIDYNGVTLRQDQWSLSGSNLTILFDDPYVTTYDEPPYFQIKYPYAV